MIKNIDSNQVAMKWVLPRTPQIVKIDGTDRRYLFGAKLHIWLAWVNLEDVARLLGTKAKVCNCNNGTYKLAFELASLLDVQLWETGGRNPLPDNLQEVEMEDVFN